MIAAAPRAVLGIVAFFVITTAATWACWFGSAATAGGTLRLSGPRGPTRKGGDLRGESR